MAILDHALAAAEAGLKVFPLRPLAKTPLHRGWQDEATTDPNTIARWFRDNNSINYGIRTGLANNLIVVDLDGKEAQEWAASLDIRSSAVVHSPSGPDRTHLYFRVYETEIPNSQSKIAPAVDIRGEGGLVVGPGSILSSGSYSGDISNIPDLPQFVIDLMPEKQTYESVDPGGDKASDPTVSEERQIKWISEQLDALERPWREGAAWRSTAYAMSCWLLRMVNSSAYAITRDQAWDLIRSHTPTDREWTERHLLEQFNSAVISTRGQYAELPRERVPNLLPYITVGNKLPVLTSDGQSFHDLQFNVDDLDTEQKEWRRRQAILVECFRAGLNDEEAVTIAWASKASTRLQADRDGLVKLWGEVPRARAMADVVTEPPADEERPALVKQSISLLTDAERRHVAEREWWGTRYLDWAKTRVAVMNAPYHRLNRWFALSAVFADAGFIPMGQPQYCNIWGINLGPTTTGKTEAWNLLNDVLKACFQGDNPNLGDDMSPEALIRVLIERDGKPSIFYSDEADGFFAKSKEGSWGAGMIPKLTKLHGCEVPTMYRQGDRENSGKDAISYFSLYLMGTVAEMTNVLETRFWKSGFLARPVWTLGDGAVRGPEAWRARRVHGDAREVYTAMPKQWAAEFSQARQKLRNQGNLPLQLEDDDDALKRMDKFLTQLGKIATGHPQEELLAPSLTRFGINIQICAALIAMSEGRKRVTLSDALVAIEQAEEWLEALIFMARETTTSLFARAVDQLEKRLVGRGGTARLEEVYRDSPDELFITNRHIAQLVAEGRVEKEQGRDGVQRLVIKRRVKEAA